MVSKLRKSWRESWNRRIDKWAAQRIQPQDQVRLYLRNIYILPSRNGLMFIVASVLVFIAAINYAVSLAFGLAFLMVSIFIIAILYTFNNLNGLVLSNRPNKPVYAGEDAAFNVLLTRSPERRHEALELNFNNGVISHADLVDQDQQVVEVYTKADRRGLLRAPLLRVTTYFPLGLARAWSVIDLNMQCLVYPRPVTFVMEHISSGAGGSDETAMVRDGSEDFYGVRDYVPGDSMRQVAWKNVARGQGMQVKQFVDYIDHRLWLDWDMFYGFGVEERLSRLCHCVLQLSRSGSTFGLKLPGLEIPPASGVEHRNRTLKALALFGTR